MGDFFLSGCSLAASLAASREWAGQRDPASRWRRRSPRQPVVIPPRIDRRRLGFYCRLSHPRLGCALDRAEVHEEFVTAWM